MPDKRIESLVKLRDAFAMASEALNEYIDTLAPKEVKDDKPVVAEETYYSILKFEPQQGTKLGSYEVAYKPNNLPDKWQSAYDILSKSNATIQSRYLGKGYAYSYWLFGEGKIYRQKRKQGANTH